MWVVGMAGPNENADRHRGAIVVQAVDRAPGIAAFAGRQKCHLARTDIGDLPTFRSARLHPELAEQLPHLQIGGYAGDRSVAMPVTGTAALIAGDCGIFPESSVISPMSWASPLRPSLTDWLKVPMFTYPPPVE